MFWMGMSHEQWQEEQDKKWELFKEGKLILIIPEKFYSFETDFGTFIQVQRSCILDEEPTIMVRSSYYGSALKAMLPWKPVKPGDKFTGVRMSQSGKSIICRIATNG